MIEHPRVEAPAVPRDPLGRLHAEARPRPRPEENLRRERLTADDIAEEMRGHEIGNFDEVAWRILEANGQINFVKK